ncbi:MAG: hypothetical protein KDA51_00460, partial [Planctomycetales bacterium]|nr:hypothetical protein [Planctomycetales bacterium]
QGDELLDDTAQLAAAGENLEDGDAVREVIKITARRMLYHLEQRPGAEDDLRDIVVLAILNEPDGEVLQQLWQTGNVRGRLNELARRYSLIAGGDLHETVRDFLRRHWRSGDRPDCFEEVLQRLEEIVISLPIEGRFGSAERIAYECRRLNILGWRNPEHAYISFAPVLATALAYDQSVRTVLELGSEWTPSSKLSSPTRKLLSDFHHGAFDDKDFPDWDIWGLETDGVETVIKWLSDCAAGQNQSTDSGPWSVEQRAALSLVLGLASTSRVTDIRAKERQLEWLDEAITGLGAENIPRKSQVGDICFALALDLWPDPHRPLGANGRLVQQAYENALFVGYDTAKGSHNLGMVLQKLGRYQEAEQHFLT